MDKYWINIEFPTKKKWLKNWWQRNVNTFLYATENKDIQEAIQHYRKTWLYNETAKTPSDISTALKRIFLKEAELRFRGKELKFHGNKAVREGDEYYLIATSNTGVETKWHLNNPFYIFYDILGVPESKIQLIKMMSDPSNRENSWIFEQRFLINEELWVYPISHILINTLHESLFLSPLRIHILNRLNLDYFVFWPMFFYYALTNDINYVLQNIVFLADPVKAFVVEDDNCLNLHLKIYGDCNFNEIFSFISENKKDLNILTKLLGNPKVSGGDIRDFYIYQTKKEKNDLDTLAELNKKGILKINKIPKRGKSYAEMIKEQALKDKTYRVNNSITRNSFKKELNIVRTVATQIKQEINNLGQYDKFSKYNEIQELLKKINTRRS